MLRSVLVSFTAAIALLLGGCASPSPSTPVSQAPNTQTPESAPFRTPMVQAVPPTPTVSPQDALALEPDGAAQGDAVARALQLKSDGDWAGAFVEARRALWKTPDDEDALRLIGKLGPELREHRLAAMAFERLGTIHVGDPAPLIQQARVLLRLGSFDEALVVAALAEARDAEDPEVFQVRGRAHLGRGELALAIAAFERVLAFSPDHGYALNNLGLAHLRSNQNEKAVEVLQRAATLLPHVAYVHNNLGVAFERVGRTADARAAYDQATALSPKYVKALVNSARVSKVASADTSQEPLPESVTTE
ncbi:MAG: tetratricopeptide repeat protein [Myxococcaceae bacterium]